ncbi:hypothetical protein Sango_2911800 [Sesamum angolense]|uniref:Reverse transcriptase zinc-binding domain-containing protein n=1 Tax=Sesamum angolense TaxID=2727404 RepID=A0AAE1T5M1_9LAMI|nr:hypothetical protein Sango_2911800 [Sesamum angolense]
MDEIEPLAAIDPPPPRPPSFFFFFLSSSLFVFFSSRLLVFSFSFHRHHYRLAAIVVPLPPGLGNEESLPWREAGLDSKCVAGHSVASDSVWHRLCRIRDMAEPFLFWTLGEGSVSFWHDNWLGDKPLAQFLHRDSYTMDSQGDKIMWTGSSMGDFSTTSAWEAIRQTSPQRQLLADVWHRSLRPIISIFLWLFFQDRISVDARMRQKGFNFPSKYQCCEAEETVSHLFTKSTAVQGVWRHFAALFGLCLCDTGSFTHMVHFWRYSTPCHLDLHIRTLIPFLILWLTWTRLNAAKYRGIPFSTDGIILEVQRYLRTLDQCARRVHCRLVEFGACPDPMFSPLVGRGDATAVISLLQSRVSRKWEMLLPDQPPTVDAPAKESTQIKTKKL